MPFTSRSPGFHSGWRLLFGIREAILIAELHIVTTGRQPLGELVAAASAAAPDADYIHLREKQWSAVELNETLDMLSSEGIPQAKLIVNGVQPDCVLRRVGGIQLPERELDKLPSLKKEYPKLAVGVSVHSKMAALQAEALGAGRLVFGHIFDTPSKPGVTPRGLDQLAQISVAVKIPVIAIGGIKTVNAAEVLAHGAAGVAILSGIMLADDPAKAASLYRKAMES